MHKIRAWFLLALILPVLIAGCGGKPFWLPKAHKIDIQQGNLLNQEQIEQITPGLPQAEVRRILGEPVLETGFDNNRWDYVYTRGEAGEHVRASGLTVFFENGVVADTQFQPVSEDR